MVGIALAKTLQHPDVDAYRGARAGTRRVADGRRWSPARTTCRPCTPATALRPSSGPTATCSRRCLDRVTAALREHHPGMGANVAIDGLRPSRVRQRLTRRPCAWRLRSDAPTTRPGQRTARAPGRSWKGTAYYGYKIDAAVCTATGLPVAWNVRTASAAETTFALPLIDAGRSAGSPSTSPSRTRAMTTAGSTTGAWTVALPGHAAAGDSLRCSRRAPTAVMRARRVDVRRGRLQAPRPKWRCPHRGVPARLAMGQGRPSASAHPARLGALARSCTSHAAPSSGSSAG